MSYDTVKNLIVGRLQGLGYAESQQVDNFTDAPSSEYGNTFIIKCLSGEMDDVESETIVDRFYDVQSWLVMIAFDRTKIEEDEMHREKDSILADIDNPTSWSGSVRIMKYNNWAVEITDNYFVLSINIKIVDTYTY